MLRGKRAILIFAWSLPECTGFYQTSVHASIEVSANNSLSGSLRQAFREIRPPKPGRLREGHATLKLSGPVPGSSSATT